MTTPDPRLTDFPPVPQPQPCPLPVMVSSKTGESSTVMPPVSQPTEHVGVVLERLTTFGEKLRAGISTGTVAVAALVHASVLSEAFGTKATNILHAIDAWLLATAAVVSLISPPFQKMISKMSKVPSTPVIAASPK